MIGSIKKHLQRKRFTDLEAVTLEELQAVPRWKRSLHAGLIWCSLPDRLRSLAQSRTYFKESESVSVFTTDRERLLSNAFPKTHSPILISINHKEWYVQVLMPLGFEGKEVTTAVGIWVRIHPLVAYNALSALYQSEPEENYISALCQEQYQFTLSSEVANILYAGSRPVGLHSMVSLCRDFNTAQPVVNAVEDCFSPYPGLASLLFIDNELSQQKGRPSTRILSEFATDSVSSKHWEHFLTLLKKNPVELLNEELPSLQYLGEAQAILGALQTNQGKLEQALMHFQLAQKLDHPIALACSQETHEQIIENFIRSVPELPGKLLSNDVKTQEAALRYASERNPAIANTLLALLLEERKEYKESLLACDKAIALNPHQPPLFSCKYALLSALNKKEEALEVAITWAKHFPQDLEALEQVIESQIQLEKDEAAVVSLRRFLLRSTSPQASLKMIHKVMQRGKSQDALLEVFERTLSCAPKKAKESVERAEKVS